MHVLSIEPNLPWQRNTPLVEAGGVPGDDLALELGLSLVGVLSSPLRGLSLLRASLRSIRSFETLKRCDAEWRSLGQKKFEGGEIGVRGACARGRRAA